MMRWVERTVALLLCLVQLRFASLVCSQHIHTLLGASRQGTEHMRRTVLCCEAVTQELLMTADSVRSHCSRSSFRCQSSICRQKSRRSDVSDRVGEVGAGGQ